MRHIDASAETTASKSDWSATKPEHGARKVSVESSMTMREAKGRIRGDACFDAVLVWGDVKADASAPVVEVTTKDGASLSGFLVCAREMDQFLHTQLENPRFKQGHGGSSEVKWRDGALVMRRWTGAEVSLGTLSPVPEGVFQKGEARAALVSVEDAAKASDVLAVLARVPTVFVFGMLELAG